MKKNIMILLFMGLIAFGAKAESEKRPLDMVEEIHRELMSLPLDGTPIKSQIRIPEGRQSENLQVSHLPEALQDKSLVDADL